jgi:hypothetical protein
LALSPFQALDQLEGLSDRPLGHVADVDQDFVPVHGFDQLFAQLGEPDIFGLGEEFEELLIGECGIAGASVATRR